MTKKEKSPVSLGASRAPKRLELAAKGISEDIPSTPSLQDLRERYIARHAGVTPAMARFIAEHAFAIAEGKRHV